MHLRQAVKDGEKEAARAETAGTSAPRGGAMPLAKARRVCIPSSMLCDAHLRILICYRRKRSVVHGMGSEWRTFSLLETLRAHTHQPQASESGYGGPG